MLNPRIGFALALVLLVGVLVGRSTGEEPVRIDQPQQVLVVPDRQPQELADLITKVLHVKPSKDTLEEVYSKLEGSARAGDLRAALILFRIADQPDAAK